MRLSVVKTDAAFKSPEECAKYEVFFNGEKQFMAYVADEEKGYIILGKRVYNAFARKWYTQLSARKYGKVEIKLKEVPNAA